MIVIKEEGKRPIKAWVSDKQRDADFPPIPDIEESAMEQLRNLSGMPFLASNGIAVMPDVHMGVGSTVGSVIATQKAIIPAAVGVDIGCGMNAVRLSLKASDLPDSLHAVRMQIERDVPLGKGGAHQSGSVMNLPNVSTFRDILSKHPGIAKDGFAKAANQLGSLGSGNHFIEVCLDENQDVWVVLHSGSRGIGNMIGSYFIEKAKKTMEGYFINLPDKNLAYLPEDTDDFNDYVEAFEWAQAYAFENRKVMMDIVIAALRRTIPIEFTITQEAINCHHNYVARESHFGQNMWITRKGAIRARKGDLGIIPGSMGAKSFIVRGKGNLESYCSCSHGAGRTMSRTEATKRFTVEDLKTQTEGVECDKSKDVLDEIPSAYKNIDKVMANQTDLVEVIHTLKQVLNVKGK